MDKAEDLVGVSVLDDAYGQVWFCLIFDHHLIDGLASTKSLDNER